MGLHQNGFRDNCGVFRYAGLTASNGSIPSALPINTALTGSMRNITAGQGITNDKVGVPLGYLAGGAWIMPQKAGYLSSRLNARVSVTATGMALRGLPAAGSASFIIDCNTPTILPLDDTSPLRTGAAEFIIDCNNPIILPLDDTSPLRTGSASFAITTNEPTGELIASGSGVAEFAITTNTPSLIASIDGGGSASFAVTTNTPLLNAIADMAGSSAISITASPASFLPLDDSSPLRTGTASFSVTGSLERYALGFMSGSTDVATVLTPASIASEVWNSALVEYQQDGSAGKSLSTASSGGVDLNLMAQAVWDYVSRTLTEGGGSSVDIPTLVAALETAVLPVNMTQVRGQTLTGTGVTADPWRPV